MIALRFPKRPTKRQPAVLGWTVKEWLSREPRCYRVTVALIRGLTPVYRATVRVAGVKPYWTRISNHRKLTAAISACQRHFNHGE